MAANALDEMVADWGGFERLVAHLNETGDVAVERDVTLVGSDGTPRQIDVLVRHRQGLYEHLVVIECKYWNRPVERLHVDALAKTVEVLAASKGVIFSTKGFQSGAIKAGRHFGIDLFKVRELSDSEWGQPGRHIELILQIMRRAVGCLVISGAKYLGGSAPDLINLNLTLSDGPEGSVTPLAPQPGGYFGSIDREFRTLEEVIAETSWRAFEQVTEERFTINDGEECVRYLEAPTTLAPEVPLRVNLETGVAIIPKICFRVAIKVEQSRVKVDRGDKLLFALAVEDCISSRVFAAARPEGSDSTTLLEVEHPAQRERSDVFRNGSLLTVRMKGFFPFDEVNGLKLVSPTSLHAPASADDKKEPIESS